MTSHTGQILQHLRSSVQPPDMAALTDEQLLQDYVRSRGEAAFAALMQRHGCMVWGVCRRVLDNDHDAEDAFQATFLVLVHKASSIAEGKLLGNWLYGVAHRTALNARTIAAKRKAREKQVIQMPEAVLVEERLWNDLQPLLDQELSYLPDKYRAVVVLCDLEGMTRREVARQLGLPEGTVASRLARARSTLAKRLTRRGVTVSSGTPAVVLAQSKASIRMPASVMSSTLKAAGVYAVNQATTSEAISPQVAALIKGALQSMVLNRVKNAMVLFALAVLAVVGSVGGYHAGAQQSIDKKPLALTDAIQPPKQPKVVPANSPEIEGVIAVPVTFAGEERAKLGKAVLELLDSCRHSQPTDKEGWLNSQRGLHVHLKFPKPAKTVKVSDSKDIPVSEVVVTFPLNKGGLWVRSGDRYAYFAKFLHPKAAKVEEVLGEKIGALLGGPKPAK